MDVICAMTLAEKKMVGELSQCVLALTHMNVTEAVVETQYWGWEWCARGGGGLISDQIIRFAIVAAAAVRESGRLKPGSGLVNIHEGTRVRARGLDCSSKTLLRLMGLKAALSTKMELCRGGLTSH